LTIVKRKPFGCIKNQVYKRGTLCQRAQHAQGASLARKEKNHDEHNQAQLLAALSLARRQGGFVPGDRVTSFLANRQSALLKSSLASRVLRQNHPHSIKEASLLPGFCFFLNHTF